MMFFRFNFNTLSFFIFYRNIHKNIFFICFILVAIVDCSLTFFPSCNKLLQSPLVLVLLVFQPKPGGFSSLFLRSEHLPLTSHWIISDQTFFLLAFHACSFPKRQILDAESSSLPTWTGPFLHFLPRATHCRPKGDGWFSLRSLCRLWPYWCPVLAGSSFQPIHEVQNLKFAVYHNANLHCPIPLTKLQHPHLKNAILS